MRAISTCPQTLSNHTGSITALDFSEPYGTLITSATDESVRVWDLCSGEEVGRLRGHNGQFRPRAWVVEGFCQNSSILTLIHFIPRYRYRQDDPGRRSALPHGRR